MGTHTTPFIGKNWVTYLPSQDKECEEEDEEGDSSHQFGLLQHPWPGVQGAQIEAGDEAVGQPGVGVQEETAGGHQP